MAYDKEWFAALHTSYPRAWTKYCLVSEQKLAAFWRANRAGSGSPFTSGLELPADLSRCIPLAFHGDGVQVTGLGKTWADGVDCWSMQSLLRQEESGLSNAIVTMVPYHLMKDNKDNLFACLQWSLQSLRDGRWPSRNKDGRPFQPHSLDAKRAGLPLANGWRGIALGLRGDLDFIVKSLDGPNYGSGEPCSLCAATAENWNDLRVTAPWRQQSRTFQSTCRLFEDVGLNLGRLLPDWMHSKHLGSDAYLAGSVLTLLVYELMCPALSLWAQHECKQHSCHSGTQAGSQCRSELRNAAAASA